MLTNAVVAQPPLNCPCQGQHFTPEFIYTAPPEGETRFNLGQQSYEREIWRCQLCQHFVSVHQMDLQSLYQQDYVNSTYGEDRFRQVFDRITSLPPEKSDNVGRVQRILEFADQQLTRPAQENRVPTILDVGSGLCVFLHRLKTAGWLGTALDPDPRMVKHAQKTVGVQGICGDFMQLSDLGQFDVITFNKVLEHVADPVAMLHKSAQHLNPGGFVYVELPDGEGAATEGPGREEFFIEHLHVFSAASIVLLIERAGFELVELERLREPSSKYTLRAFAIPEI